MFSSLSSRLSSRWPASRLLQRNNICRRIIPGAVQLTTKAAPSSLSWTSFLPPQPNEPASFLPPTTITRRPISHTPSHEKQITVDLPSLGDSITEGTIVEWCVPPGSHVREGDVLALIETDKVTVDIKADREGVLVKQLGEVEEEVEVGTGLYVLDTDVANAEGVAAEMENTAEVNAMLDAEKMAAAAEEPPSSPPSSAPDARVPSIHFLGKEGWKEKLSATDDAAPPPAAVAPTSNKPHAPTSITNMPYESMYGRPPITNEEIEALILGGAEEAPEVRSVVSEKEGLSGVVFVGGKVVTAGPRGVWLAE